MKQDPNNTNYCAYCGCWALGQFEGFCLACWDEIKKKAKEEKEMNNTNYCAFCGERTLEQTNDMCPSCWDTAKAEAKKADKRCTICRHRNSYVRRHAADDGHEILWSCNDPGCSNFTCINPGGGEAHVFTHWMKESFTPRGLPSKPPAPSPESPGPSVLPLS